MILSKPNALVYVYRNGLIVAGKHITQARLSFGPELVTNLEVLNPDKLIERCRQFFTDNGLRHRRVVVVLDHSLVFEKKIELDQSGKPDVLAEAFVAAMPFEEGLRACLQVQTDKQLQLLATNARIYQSVAQALHACGVAKVVAITPVNAFVLPKEQRKVSSLVEVFLKDTASSKEVDFTSVQPL